MIASSESTAAHMPRRGDRSGWDSAHDRLRRSIDRASPTVTTEPVISTPPAPMDEPDWASASPAATSMASASRGSTVTRSSP